MRADRTRKALCHLNKDKNGNVALIIGLSAISLIGMVALAVDFGSVIASKARLDTAADAAVMTATMTATEMFQTNPDVTDFTQAINAANDRFTAQAGADPYVSGTVVAVAVTHQNDAFQATVTYTANYQLPIPFIYDKTWILSNTVGSRLDLSQAYLNVTLLLDNSGSMEIGASQEDIRKLMLKTACSVAGAYYPAALGKNNNVTSWVDAKTAGKANYVDPQAYSAYACRTSSHEYTGILNCPIAGFPTGGHPGPDCTDLPPVVFITGDGKNAKTTSVFPKAGAPCAFACHFDKGSPASSSANDHFGIARANGVTLRFDLVKSAVNTLLTTMQLNDTGRNLKVNIGAFTDVLTPVYPTDWTFGENWTTAIEAVGGHTATGETGIQPYIGANGGDTDFDGIMNSLNSRLPTCTTDNPCNGYSATTPKRALFIVTDGLNDPASRVQGGFNVAKCKAFKDKGYQIFVVYTSYYPLMNPYYLDTDAVAVEGTGTGSVSGNLQACATSSAHYISATDGASITAALQDFFRRAVSTPARFTQ